MSLTESASSAGVAEAASSPKGIIVKSKTFRDGVIQLYKCGDFKKPSWMRGIKVTGGKPQEHCRRMCGPFAGLARKADRQALIGCLRSPVE